MSNKGYNRFNYVPKTDDQEIAAFYGFLLSLGFEEISTGGGCTAWNKSYSNGLELNVAQDCSASIEREHFKTVGIDVVASRYDKEGSDGGFLGDYFEGGVTDIPAAVEQIIRFDIDLKNGVFDGERVTSHHKQKIKGFKFKNTFLTKQHIDQLNSALNAASEFHATALQAFAENKQYREMADESAALILISEILDAAKDS